MTANARELVQRQSADKLVRRVAAVEPDTVALAEVVALAVKVDPALLRAARRALLPHRGPDLEADLWHSPLVSGANPSGLVFEQPVVDRLLLRLARNQHRCEQARAVVATEHRAAGGEPPGWITDTVRLEEALRYLTLVPDGHSQARRLLLELQTQVRTSGAVGLKAWLAALEGRLPLSLRGASRAPAADAEPGRLTVGVRLLDGAVEIRSTPYGTMPRLDLPGGPPPAAFVEGRLVALESLPHIEPLDRPGQVTVQALDGASITLRRRRRQLTPHRQRTLQAHTAATSACAFSPDGTLLATTGADHTVRLWDPATNARVAVLAGHTAAVTACAFSPDGALLATAGHDRIVRLWAPEHGGDWASCAEVTKLTDHEGAVLGCAFSPDGSLLATTGANGAIRIWRVATRKTVHVLTGYAASIESAAFSPDGSLLAVTSADRTVRLCDPVRGEEVRTLTGHTSSVWACAFSADGSLLASTSNDGTARLWDPATGVQLHAFSSRGARLRSCAFSPDGAVLAVAGDNEVVHLWDPTVAAPPQRLAGHTSWVYGCAYAPDGAFLATAGADDTVRLWDPPTGLVNAVLERYERPEEDDGDKDDEDDETDRGHESAVEDCAVAPDGKRIATASADTTAGIWDLAGKRTHKLKGHGDRVNACAYSPDGTLLATASSDGTAILWDPATGESLARLRGHDGPVQACAFSPDGTRLATAGDDQTVRLWDPDAGVEVQLLRGHLREVLACAFSPNGRWLATTGKDQTVRLWDPGTGAAGAVLRGHASRVHACGFSPDGSLLASASADGTVRLWDPERAEALDELVGPASMLDCAFNPDGTALAATSSDRTITIWDLLRREVAVKGDTVALWLGGRQGDDAALAGAVAARQLTAGCTPVLAMGGGAVPGVLLAAGLTPPRVRQAVVAADRMPQGLPLVDRWLGPLARLRRALAACGVARCGDLRVPIGDLDVPGADEPVPADRRLQRYRFHAVVVDTVSDEVVVLPHDARRLGIDPDAIPLAPLALAAAGERDLTLGGRRFTSARGRTFDPGPWFADLPTRRPVFAVDVEDSQGVAPARRFPVDRRTTTVTIPWLHRRPNSRPSRRQREVLARIGAQSLRTAVVDEPAPPSTRRRRVRR